MLGPTEQTGYGEIPNTVLASIIHTPLTGESSMPGLRAGVIDSPGAVGIGHTDVAGDVNSTWFGDSPIMPALGDTETTAVRLFGVMEIPPRS